MRLNLGCIVPSTWAGRERGSEAKFVTVWQEKDGVWKVARVISYDHASLAK